MKEVNRDKTSEERTNYLLSLFFQGLAICVTAASFVLLVFKIAPLTWMPGLIIAVLVLQYWGIHFMGKLNVLDSDEKSIVRLTPDEKERLDRLLSEKMNSK